jgi:hypothetical protein
MGKQVTLRCDVCKKPTERIVGKLHFIPVNGLSRSAHSNYTHHADVGECCKERLLHGFAFRKRMTRSQYLEARKNGMIVQ